MQLDDLKEAWAAHGAVMERSLAIDERLLREVLLRKVKFAIAPHVLWRALEVALGIAAMLAVVSVLVAHTAEPRYLIVAGALAVFTFAMTAMTAYLLVRSLQLDYDGPVATIQRTVERIKLAEYRVFKWALLGGVVMWLPVLLVLFEALTGINALGRVDLVWLVSNLLFGVVFLAIGQALSRKYVERRDLKPWARRLVDALAGRPLQRVAAHLAELSRFEREESPRS
ncbi:MAG: hypothetical protein SGJ11_09670 [Phycisphaerae bacterium]|nr:hypothetical protein [Phycisphaerae bacterium]